MEHLPRLGQSDVGRLSERLVTAGDDGGAHVEAEVAESSFDRGRRFERWA